MSDGSGDEGGDGPPHGRPAAAWRLLDRLLDSILALTVAAASGAIFAQVIFRYLLNRPLVWADEFAVLVFAWMTFVGAAVVQRSDSHIAIDALTRVLPVAVERALYVLRVVAIAAVLGLVFWQGLALSERMLRIEYPAMGISRAWLYATLPVCAPLIMLYLARSLAARLRAGFTAEAQGDDWEHR